MPNEPAIPLRERDLLAVVPSAGTAAIASVPQRRSRLRLLLLLPAAGFIGFAVVFGLLLGRDPHEVAPS